MSIILMITISTSRFPRVRLIFLLSDPNYFEQWIHTNIQLLVVCFRTMSIKHVTNFAMKCGWVIVSIFKDGYYNALYK